MDNMKIKSAEACYTGGGCYVYTGKLENGLFFIGSDNWESVAICNENVDIEEEIPEEFWENHIVEELIEEPYKEFFNYMLYWLIDNAPEGNYLVCELERRIITDKTE